VSIEYSIQLAISLKSAYFPQVSINAQL